MSTSTSAAQYIPFAFTTDNIIDNSADSNEAYQKLQARIVELEKELKKQKEAAEKGAKLVKLMWGDKFESDSLH